MAPALTEAELLQFTGTTQWFRHALMRTVTYTEGVRYVAERAGAYWLIDKIATLQLEPRIGRYDQLQVWTLRVDDGAGILTCAGHGDTILHSEPIHFTDFPLAKIEIWFQHGVICLPSEH